MKNLLIMIVLIVAWLAFPKGLFANIFSKTKELRVESNHPYVGLLKTPKGDCTASLIAENAIITSAHCIQDYIGKSDELEFFLQYKRGDYTDSSIGVQITHYMELGKDGKMIWNRHKRDFAIIRLKKNLGVNGFFKIAEETPKLETKAFMVSYPGDFDYALEQDCSVKEVIEFSHVYHDCGSVPGASGSPIFTVDDEGVQTILAMHAGSMKAGEQLEKGEYYILKEYDRAFANYAMDSQYLTQGLASYLEHEKIRAALFKNLEVEVHKLKSKKRTINRKK